MAGFNNTTVVFETSANVFGDSRVLKFVADGADADTLPDLFLGNQRVFANVAAAQVTPFNAQPMGLTLEASHGAIMPDSFAFG